MRIKHLALALLLGCGGAPTETACLPEGEAMDPERLRECLAYLASPALEGRKPGSDGDAAARERIAEVFRRLELVPGGVEGSYQQPYPTAEGPMTANVIGYIPGSDPALAEEVILFGAHHDHFGLLDGEYYLGANDNASGTAGVLAIAQAFRDRGLQPRRTVAFATFGSEEWDYWGSEYYASHAPSALPMDRTVYNINLDMIGTYPHEALLHAQGAEEGTPGRVLLEGLLDDHAGLSVTMGTDEPDADSDYYYLCEEGVPYVYFWVDDDECYHLPCDTAEKIDYPSLAQIAALATDLGAALADSDLDLSDRQQLVCD